MPDLSKADANQHSQQLVAQMYQGQEEIPRVLNACTFHAPSFPSDQSSHQKSGIPALSLYSGIPCYDQFPSISQRQKLTGYPYWQVSLRRGIHANIGEINHMFPDTVYLNIITCCPLDSDLCHTLLESSGYKVLKSNFPFSSSGCSGTVQLAQSYTGYLFSGKSHVELNSWLLPAQPSTLFPELSSHLHTV